MDTGYRATFAALTAEVPPGVSADLWAVARIMAVLVQDDPYRWPSVQFAGGEQVLEARFGCGRMQFTVTDGAVEIADFSWSPDDDGHGGPGCDAVRPAEQHDAAWWRGWAAWRPASWLP
jgi:hypothetical protein